MQSIHTGKNETGLRLAGPQSGTTYIVASLAVFCLVGALSAQTQQNQDTARAEEVATPLIAEVIEVSGSVDRAAPEVSPLVDKGWMPVKVGDRLDSGTQVRTGLRSHVNLRFGDTTVVSIRSATHASIDQFYRSAKTENVRIGLSYGTVRGSSSEGELLSDVVIDSTIATLAKRGTEGWELWVEPMTGRFRVSLAESGLVEAIQKLRGQRTVSRRVAPGEYANWNNIANMWIQQAVFDRNVAFYDSYALTSADSEFTASNLRGLGVVDPGGGSQVSFAGGGGAPASILGPGASRPPTVVIEPGLLRRSDGNFGTPDTFRVLVPKLSSKASRTRN
jgi:hypothetical protein